MKLLLTSGGVRNRSIKKISEIIYALDDKSALKIIDGKVEIISEGEYLIFNK